MAIPPKSRWRGRWALGLAVSLCSWLSVPVSHARQESTVRQGDVEMHCVAIPAVELTPDAAREFNVSPAPDRGVLTITLLRYLAAGQAKSEAGQVFAGAINMRNSLSSIPVREVRRDGGVYYLGEYRLSPPDTLRFLVNANLGARSLTADFSQEFPAAP